jgi:hypothetical protein
MIMRRAPDIQSDLNLKKRKCLRLHTQDKSQHTFVRHTQLCVYDILCTFEKGNLVHLFLPNNKRAAKQKNNRSR